MSGRQRASSPLSRGGKHMSPEPWSSAASTGVSGDVDDVELDLDGMDMRMGEADEEDQEELRDDEEDSTSSSPSKRNANPSRQRQNFTPGPSSRSETRSYEAGTPAPPLRRVLQLLKEEAKPGEGEVASEAKVTKRLGAINEAAAARSMREGSPFAMAARGTTPLRDADAIAGPQRGAGPAGGALAGPAAAAVAGDDDLLDNVGFESSSSDALSSASEDGYIDDSDGTYEPASTPASLPPDVHSTGVTAAQDDMQMDDRDDEAMLDDSAGTQGGDAGLSMTPSANQQNPSAAVTSSGLFPISAISTPPPRFSTPSLPSSANVSPVNERGQAPAYAWEGRHLARGGTEAPRTPLSLSAMGVGTGDAGRSLSISSPSSSSTAATPTQVSATGPLRGTGGVATGRKRTGSAWMDFRNSPNNASANPAGSSAAGGVTSGSLGGGGGGSSFDKRHHRLHGHHGRPYPHPHHHHKAKDMALAAAANRGLSTSPASTSAAYPGALAGFTAAASSRASSPTLAAAAVTSSASASAATKRKFGFGGSDSPGGSSSGGSSSGAGTGERSSDRFEPYMTSAYKRRAVSPLMSLGSFGGGAGGVMSSPVGHGGGGGGAESVGGTASSPARYPYHHSPAAWYHRNSVTSPTTAAVSSYFPPTSSGAAGSSSASSSNANAAAAAAVAGSSSSPLLSAVAPRTAAAREAAAQAAASAALGSLSDLHGLGMGGAEDGDEDELGGGRGAAAAARAALPVRRREGTPTRVGTGNRASSGGSSSGGGMSCWGFPKSRMAQQTTATSTTPANSSSSPASSGIPPFGEDDAGLGPSVLAGGSRRQE